MEKLTFPSAIKNLDTMISFITDSARSIGFDEKELFQIRLAAEEVLVNIINYAYPARNGDIEITLTPKETDGLVIQVADEGVPFDPLALPEPDIATPMEKRKIGGLGIFLVRKLMNEVNYQRLENRNILTLVKLKAGARLKSPVDGQEKSQIAQTDKSAQVCTCPWPLEFMKKETFKKGEILFKKGDEADKMFYITKGSLRLLEIDKVVREGQIIGEMGIFSPFKERTASAVCEEALETYTMGKKEVLDIFSRDPSLAINLIQISVKRFIENMKKETEARERIASELRIAAEIQTSMLPRKFPPFPERDEFDIFAMMDPAKEVGGDFYDFFFVAENKLCFVIGDVSGKGVPAALFMAISKTVLKTEALLGLPCEKVLHQVNNILYPDNQMCMFVTVLCVILDVQTGEIELSNGGHNPPLVCSGNVCYEFIDLPKGFVVGAIENMQFENKKIKLKPGDIIFLYTDGVTEAMNPQKQLFSENRLKEYLTKLKDKDIKDIIFLMREEIRGFAAGESQSDDITMIALKFKGKQ